MTPKRRRVSTRHIVLYAMLGTLMYLSKLLMEWAPNIHFIGMLTMTYTIVYRRGALIPLYLFVFLSGLFGGFGPWWIPYLYVWTVLWGVTMLLPRSLPAWAAAPVYMLVCALHGLSFGVLYAPSQALMFGMSFKAMLAWVAAGLPFDLLHAAGNLASGVLILPLSRLLLRLEKM